MESMVTFVQPPPYKLEDAHQQIFSPEAIKFIFDLVKKFDSRVDQLFLERTAKQLYYAKENVLPTFPKSPERKDLSWKINPLPTRLRCRYVDIGDVSPSNTAHFIESLKCDAQGVQVDFDDGHCPTWKNQILGYHNIIQAVFGKLTGAPCNINTCPILMLRPRAWNILEHNVLVNGKEIPGALLDFAILMFHCGKHLMETGCGPFFYLSKLEAASEAKLWNDIFIWSQERLDIPRGTIKACVLIENILCAFETVEILYVLREHSMGLNCGIWDYIASIISKFGSRENFVLPDRKKHVSAESSFLKVYREMIIRDCHMRGAPATGGMVALLLNPGTDETSPENSTIINNVLQAKQKEIAAGVDGFLLYDHRMLRHINELWKKQCATSLNQMDLIPNLRVKPSQLLEMPVGGSYLTGLKHNVAVSILFFYYWLAGVGHFFYEGLVEDSATAEISRCQVWQYIQHKVVLDDGQKVNYHLVEKIAFDFTTNAHKTLCRSNAERKRINAAKFMCLELFIMRYPPAFITTYLNDSHKFRTIHNKALLAKHRSNL